VIAKPSLSYSYASSSSNVIEETARAIDSVVEKGPVLDTSIDHFNEPEQEDDKHSDWDSFQAAYPQPKRNTRIEPACRAYVGRIDGKLGEHGRLMAGLQRHLVSDQWVRSLRDDGGRFIPSMEKFIVDGLYSDHPPAYRPETSAKNEYSLAIAKMYSEVQREKEEENS
jgi:hypothetical protein